MKMLKKLQEVSQKIAKKHGIKYLLLFGSLSKNYTFEGSDLDIAVKIKELPKSFKEKIGKMNEIGLEFEKELGIETDVIILNDADLGLKFEIFRTGKTLYCGNRSELADDKARAMAEYHDFNFWCEELYKKMLAGFGHGRK